MKSLLLATTMLVSASVAAQAATVTFGFWDQAIGGSVQPIITTGDTGPVRFTTGELYLGNNWGGVFNWVSDPNAGGNGFYEFAVNDVFSSTADTARFYATFQNITTPFPQLTIPTFYQSESINQLIAGAPTSGIIDEVFTCPAGSALFCDNYVTGGGNLIDHSQEWFSPGSSSTTLSTLAPGSPYDITLVIHIGSGISQNVNPIGDFASAVGVQPFPTAPVPGPIVGGGIPGLLALGAFLLYRKRAGGRELA